MTMEFLRAYCERQAVESGAPGAPIRFVASTDGMARDGKALNPEDFHLDNFRRNPVFLWVHDYWGQHLPIGRVPNVEATGGQLLADVEFDQADEFARAVESKYRRGFLNAVSIGWQDVQEGKRTWHDLLDISGVPVPADPNALKLDEARALASLDLEIQGLLGQFAGGNRGAIPPHSTDKAPEDMAWDGPGEMAKCEATESALRRIAAWVDSEMDPATKRAYKLPHHTAEGLVVWRGVAAAMARLLQAGTEIPEGDRRGVYNHLTRHYQQFDKTAPEFRTGAELALLGPEEIRGLFLEGEVYPMSTDMRAGAMLSARNKGDLEQAVALIQAVLERATKETPVEPPPDEEGNGQHAHVEGDALLSELHRIFLGGQNA